MRQVTATITGRGQVTLPAEIRRLLGVSSGDKVAFIIEDSQVRIAKPRHTLETAYGAIPARHQPEELLDLSEQAKERKAEESRDEMGRA